MIKKTKLGWQVMSGTGKKLGGPYPTERMAQTRLAQVEFFKKLKPAKKSR